MLLALWQADILVILGISGGIFLPFINLISNKKIIVNIDGIEWKRGKWGSLARWFLKLSEGFAVRHADVIIADNNEIALYVKSTYGAETEQIAYGGDHVRAISLTDPEYQKQIATYPFINSDYAFCVCRIEPENNIGMILQAFAKSPSQQLVIVGNWNYSSYGKELKDNYQTLPNIFLYDPIYDQQQLDLLRSNTSLYMHGHSVGGTNPALVEAMNLGLSILAFDVSYNRETTENKAAYFEDEQQLVEQINQQGSDHCNGEAMLDVAQRRYRWDIIAAQYKVLFDAN